jgi:regulator of RNase E activity RraA
VIPELEGATSALVADALDRLGLREQTMEPGIRPLRLDAVLAGRAVPVVVEVTDEIPQAPYATEMRVIDSLAADDVPVYSVGSGVRAALWGELFSCAAIGRGAAGVIVDGLVRDARQIAELGFPVFCRGTSPLDTQGRAKARDVGGPVRCGGVLVSPGDYVVADQDGIVVIPEDARGEVARIVAEKTRGERGARDDLLAGKSLAEVWETWGVL